MVSLITTPLSGESNLSGLQSNLPISTTESASELLVVTQPKLSTVPLIDCVSIPSRAGSADVIDAESIIASKQRGVQNRKDITLETVNACSDSSNCSSQRAIDVNIESKTGSVDTESLNQQKNITLKADCFSFPHQSDLSSAPVSVQSYSDIHSIHSIIPTKRSSDLPVATPVGQSPGSIKGSDSSHPVHSQTMSSFSSPVSCNDHRQQASSITPSEIKDEVFANNVVKPVSNLNAHSSSALSLATPSLLTPNLKASTRLL